MRRLLWKQFRCFEEMVTSRFRFLRASEPECPWTAEVSAVLSPKASCCGEASRTNTLLTENIELCVYIKRLHLAAVGSLPFPCDARLPLPCVFVGLMPACSGRITAQAPDDSISALLVLDVLITFRSPRIDKWKAHDARSWLCSEKKISWKE